MRDVEGLPEQIASHSSFLTNKRIDLILQKIDFWKEESWARPCVPNLERYFASLYTLFDNVFMIMKEHELQEIKSYFSLYWKIYKSLKIDKEKQNLRTVFSLLFILDKINRGIKAVLQKYKYFFVMVAKDAKTIEDGLKILERGGGIFGRISTVPEDTDELGGKND